MVTNLMDFLKEEPDSVAMSFDIAFSPSMVRELWDVFHRKSAAVSGADPQTLSSLMQGSLLYYHDEEPVMVFGSQTRRDQKRMTWTYLFLVEGVRFQGFHVFADTSAMKGLWQSVLKKGQELGTVEGAHTLVIFMDDVAVCCVPIVLGGGDPVKAKFESCSQITSWSLRAVGDDVPHVDRRLEIFGEVKSTPAQHKSHAMP